VLDRSLVKYKGKKIDLGEVDYQHRTYEHEAQWETLVFWKKFLRYKREQTELKVVNG
jgi:hypothetical protein